MRAEWSALVLGTLIALGGCGATRPPGPPEGLPRQLPWGAVSGAPDAPPTRESLEGSLSDGIERLLARTSDPAGEIPYRALVLSGGGSRGAFGAGFLEGWTASGNRPQFDVVTGISTGALIATFAFLGADYDEGLRLYTQVENRDIFRRGGRLRLLTGPSLHDTAPLAERLERELTEEIIAAVAAEHAAGRRLFVGTTNLESGAFTIWDLGAIAASGRPDRLERYRAVLLAAASFPVVFPPVYIPVDIDGTRYWEAHVDGATRAAVLGRAFMLDVEDLRERLEGKSRELDTEIYAILNARPTRVAYGTIGPRVGSIAMGTVSTMLDGVATYSNRALFQMAMLTGADFRMTWIPTSTPLTTGPLEFEPAEMTRLFELGHEMARSPTPFIVEYAAPSDAEELLDLVDPDGSFELDAEALEEAAGIR